MIEVKKFSGVMNKDDKEENILPAQHIDALNLRFYGGSNGLTAQNIVGNTLVSNTNLPVGNNECIGAFFDSLKQRLFWLNWNSNDRHGIYFYSISTQTVTPLLVCFTDSTTDILGFDLDYPAASINIIYTTEDDGDILTWVTRNKRPKELNILSAIDNLYGSDWLEEYLDVAKAPPSIPIQCAYEDDATVTVNNLKNKLYKFKYRYWYGDNLKSTWSAESEMPIPFNYATQANDTDATKNCRIALILQTGATDVYKIEIAATENINDVDSNFFSVQILNKSELSIADNDAYIWNFYNNEAYNYIDLNESILAFDRVPNLSNTQELLNGNTLVYGGITEGYNPVVPDVTISASAIEVCTPDTSIAILALQDGVNGLATGNIKIVLAGLVAYPLTGVGDLSTVNVVVYNGASPDTLQAFAISAATTIADMIAQLVTSATGAGYTVVSSDANSLIISRANQVLLNYYVSGNGSNVKPINQSVPAYDWSSKWNYGLRYFDEKYKDNGVTTSEDFSVTSPAITFLATSGTNAYITRISLLIYHRPPLWAKTYQVVRTKNLTKSSLLNWMSDRTFKDVEFAYISIESINLYKVQNPTSVVTYDFLQGDRIKFCALFNNDKTINQVYGNTHDYEINSSVFNPNINGLVCPGQFIKIKLPATTVNFDFGNFLTNAYYYYYIELYTPAKSVANNLNVYYEFSQQYQIGNAGTNLAFHQGNIVNQSTNLATPASVRIEKGDAYYRQREIRAGAYFIADSVPDITYTWNEAVLQLGIQNIPVGTTYTVKNQVSGTLASDANNYLIKTGLTAVSFSVKGSLLFQALSGTTSSLIVYLAIRNIGGTVPISLTALQTITGSATGQILKFDIDVNFTVPANRTATIYLQQTPVPSVIFTAKSISGQLTFIDSEHDFQLGIVDENFSDFYASKVNSNGRADVVHPDEREMYFPTLLRWSLAYQQNTNINQINRFYPLNFDEIDRSKGDIQRFKSRDRTLRVFQNRAVGQYGVYARFIQNNQGDSQLVTTDEILTKNNISYYAGEYGLGDQYTGLVSANNNDYFVDPVRGYQVRLGNDGLTPISEIYKGQFYIRNLLVPYNKTFLRDNGSKAKILGCYDYFDEQYIAVLQAGTNSTGAAEQVIDAYTFSFNERRNGYCSFYSYKPEWILSAEDVIYSWLNGQLYIHNNTANYCNFYGVQYDVSITLVFNINLLEKKTWESITELASTIWASPLIYGNVMSYGSTRQETMLGEYDFANLESNFHAAILRDQNSIGGIINGDEMKGNYLCVKLMKQNASDLIYLSEVSVMFKDSPLTNK